MASPPAGSASRLALRVQPGARRSAWVGRLADGRWKVKVAAPPLEGRANDALLAFVAASLGLPRRAVRLVRGGTARDKQLEIDLAADEVERRLAAHGAAGGEG